MDDPNTCEGAELHEDEDLTSFAKGIGRRSSFAHALQLCVENSLKVSPVSFWNKFLLFFIPDKPVVSVNFFSKFEN